MDTRVAVISIIVSEAGAVEELNKLLHAYSQYIIGRMGIPYREKQVNIICVAVEAPQNDISALSGRLGRLKGVTSKVAYSNT